MASVTLQYPFEPMEAPPEYRGKPVIDSEKCVGCGACSRVCPPDAITIIDDLEKGVRRVILDVARCIRCARCEEVCPCNAIKLTREFELATPNREELVQVVEIPLARCRVCGGFTEFTVKQIEKAMSIVKHLPQEELEELLESMSVCKKCRLRNLVSKLSEAGYLG